MTQPDKLTVNRLIYSAEEKQELFKVLIEHDIDPDKVSREALLFTLAETLRHPLKLICEKCNTLTDVPQYKHPSPVNGICECECNSRITELYVPDGQRAACSQCNGKIIARPSQNPLVDNLIIHKNEFKIPPGTKLGRRPSQNMAKAVCVKCEQEIFYLDEHEGGCPAKAQEKP